MVDFVTQAVRRLREDPGFSRNRFYLALSSPEGRRALRIHRHLRSLERDLAAGSAARAGAATLATQAGPDARASQADQAAADYNYPVYLGGN